MMISNGRVLPESRCGEGRRSRPSRRFSRASTPSRSFQFPFNACSAAAYRRSASSGCALRSTSAEAAACSWSRSACSSKYSVLFDCLLEAVVLDQAGELRLRYIGLARLDGVQDCSCFEGILGLPGGDAFLGFGRRLAVEWRFERGGEIVPEGDVSCLLGGVLRRRRLALLRLRARRPRDGTRPHRTRARRGSAHRAPNASRRDGRGRSSGAGRRRFARSGSWDSILSRRDATPAAIVSLDQVRRSMPATALARASSSKR